MGLSLARLQLFAEKRKCRDVPIEEGFRGLSRIRLDETAIDYVFGHSGTKPLSRKVDEAADAIRTERALDDKIALTGGATGAFSTSLRVRKMRKTLRMLMSSSSAASPLVLPASTKAKTCSALARAVGMPPRYLPSAFALDAFQLPRQHDASFKLGDYHSAIPITVVYSAILVTNGQEQHGELDENPDGG